MSSVQIRPPRFISPSRKVRTLRLGFFIGACDPRVRASRFIPRHSLLPASQSTCGHSLATQSAPSVAPKVVKSGRPDSFRSKFFFVQSTNFAPGLFHFVCDSRSSTSQLSADPSCGQIRSAKVQDDEPCRSWNQESHGDSADHVDYANHHSEDHLVSCGDESGDIRADQTAKAVCEEWKNEMFDLVSIDVVRDTFGVVGVDAFR